MTIGGLDAHWWWLLIAALLAILEIFVSGVFLVWIAAAAALTGILALVSGIPLPFQLAVFALLAIASVYAGRRNYERNPVASSDPLLNDRAARLIGQKVTVITAIEDGEGRVKVGDGVWPARGPDAETGARMVVTGVEGSTLIVEPVHALPGASGTA